MSVCTVKDHGVTTLQKRFNLDNCIPVGPFNSSYLAIVHRSACNKFLKSCKSTLDTGGGKFAKSG